ncbi:HIT family protein [Peribacillus sp. SCS-26]|uniref:HIT family protein n=1 Tax=Paraperibacillus marinus TaxID=3115295 RepID=UPI003905AB28
MGDCFICNKYRGEYEIPGGIIYEDDFVAASHIDMGRDTTYSGYIMLDLKRHAPSLGDMTEEEAAAFGIAMSRISRALKESEGAEHVYAQVSGNAVAHLHMHIVPRYPGTPEEFWGPRDVLRWPGAPMADKAGLQEVSSRLKNYLSQHSLT